MRGGGEGRGREGGGARGAGVRMYGMFSVVKEVLCI